MRGAVRRRAALALSLLAALALAACGTRLPDSAFLQAGASGGEAAGTGPGIAGAGPSGPASGARSGGSDRGGSGPAGSTVSAGTASRGGAAAGARSGGGARQSTGTGRTARNGASDVGVTATTIRVGTVQSISNPFDPAAFVGPLYGVQAFFRDLNARGGINGRRVQVLPCDDKGSGQKNQACVRGLVDSSKVFAFVGNAVLDYAGAAYVSSRKVPDIGGQPADTAYDTYPMLFSIYGSSYPRDGKSPGWNGTLYGGTEVPHYFKLRYPKVPLKAGVVYYNQSISTRYGTHLANTLKAEGYQVTTEQVNFALPDYNSAVIDMKSKGVKYVYDVLDSAGGAQLCKAMDANGLVVQAKISTTQGWNAAVPQRFADSPKCRASLFASGETRNYDDVSAPQVAPFRAAMKRYGYDQPDRMGEWALEGWAAAKWFSDAAASCGADLTRRCVLAFMTRKQPYNAGGLFDDRNFVPRKPTKTIYNCVSIARWVDGRGWVTQPAVGSDRRGWYSCFRVYYLPYPA